MVLMSNPLQDPCDNNVVIWLCLFRKLLHKIYNLLFSFMDI